MNITDSIAAIIGNQRHAAHLAETMAEKSREHGYCEHAEEVERRMHAIVAGHEPADVAFMSRIEDINANYEMTIALATRSTQVIDTLVNHLIRCGHLKAGTKRIVD